MNTAMLRYLVDLAAGEVTVININKFFQKFPLTASNRKDISLLNQLGYISVHAASDEIESIAVNKKALDYFK